MNSEVKVRPETLESYHPLLFAIAYQLTGADEAYLSLSQMTLPHRLMADHARKAMFLA